jgi:hypothetical protein
MSPMGADGHAPRVAGLRPATAAPQGAWRNGRRGQGRQITLIPPDTVVCGRGPAADTRRDPICGPLRHLRHLRLHPERRK